jgi:hypothetical protein
MWSRGALLFGVSLGLLAQSHDRLHATLLRLADPNVPRAAILDELVADLQSLAPRDRQPTLGTLREFADPFVRALAGRKLSPESLTAIETSLRDVLRVSGSTMSPASRLREQLNRTVQDAADTDLIVKRFVKLGEEMRGPDDTPVQRLRLK